MLYRIARKPLVLTAALSLMVGAAALQTHRAMADSSKSSNVDDRLSKEASQRMKDAIKDDDTRTKLKQDIAKSQAMHELAGDLSQDAQFQEQYHNLVKSKSHSKDITPDNDEVQKAKDAILANKDDTREVLAWAMVIVNRGDANAKK